MLAILFKDGGRCVHAGIGLKLPQLLTVAGLKSDEFTGASPEYLLSRPEFKCTRQTALRFPTLSGVIWVKGENR